MASLPRSRAPRAFAGSGAALVAAAALLSGCFGGSPSASPSAPAVSPSAATGSASVSQAPASASVAPAGGELGVGTYAQVMVDGLRVRVSAKASATPVGALFFGDVVRIRAKAGEAGGYTWYEVESFQTANDQPVTGYVAGAKGDTAYLKALAGKPSPTPSRSPTPRPTASPSAAGSG